MRIFIVLLAIIGGFNACSSEDNKNQRSSPGEDNYKKYISTLIDEGSVKGYAIALFDTSRIIWSDCYGLLSDEKKIDSETIFSIQSMSKTITATAAMLAVQKGLISLDTPVTKYLPDFMVNSPYEKDPQNKITMRTLLGCTAGFTHEAPVGNNYDASFASYEEHCKSISNTWLKFPVGSDYSYSNLCLDLAAYIIEKTSGIPYSEYLEKEIFQPLGMKYTTIYPSKILSNKNRASGNTSGLSSIPAIMPFYGAGAVYTNIIDLVKFVQLHLRSGRLDAWQLIREELLNEMYKPLLVNYNDYALGIAFTKEGESFAYTHSGGGFGFGATMKWYPEYKTGVIILTNNDFTPIIYNTASMIAGDYIKQKKIKRDTTGILVNPVALYEKLKSQKPAKAISANFKIPGDSVYKPEWEKFTGTYPIVFGDGFKFRWYASMFRFFGLYTQKVKVFEKDNALYLKIHNGSNYLGEEKLTEYEPGLFFTPGGEALDFRGSKPRYRNLELEL